MSKYKKKIDRQYNKEFKKLELYFRKGNFKQAETLSFKLYKFYKNKNDLTNASKCLDAYTTILISQERNIQLMGYLKELFEYAQITSNKHLKAVSLSRLGLVYKDSNYDKSKELFEKAYRTFKDLKDYNNMITVLINIGNLMLNQGVYETALKYFQNAMALGVTHNIKDQLSSIYASLMIIYQRLNMNEEYGKFYELTVKNLEFTKNPATKATILTNIMALSGVRIEDYNLLEKIYEYCDQSNLQGVKIGVLLNIVELNLIDKNFSKAEKKLETAFSIAENNKLNLDKANVLNSYGKYYYQKGDIESSIKYYLKSNKLGKKYNLRNLLINNYKTLGKIYKENEEFYKSYRNYSQTLKYYNEISDEIPSSEVKEKFREIYKELPEIIENINEILELKEISPNLKELNQIQEIASKTCKIANQHFNDMIKDDCITQNEKLLQFINNKKGYRLETDTRELFRRKDNFKIKSTGEEFRIDETTAQTLLSSNCLKDNKTKTIEIDIFGDKKEDKEIYYILGECKYKKTIIREREIKCFFLKANIIAKSIIDTLDESELKHHRFILAIISLGGFPKYEKIKELLNKFWKNANDVIMSPELELIDYNSFIQLLKINNIKASFYQGLSDILS